jgi:hypothetical protein
MYRNKHTLSFLWTTETPLAKFELPDLNSFSIFSHSLTNQHVVYSTRIADIGTLPVVTPHLSRPISLPDGLSTMDTRLIQASSGAVNIEGEEGEGNEESVEMELQGEEEGEGEEEEEEGQNIPYLKAIQVLKRLTEYSSAKKKLWCIHSALQTCIKCVQKFWRERKPEKNVVV